MLDLSRFVLSGRAFRDCRWPETLDAATEAGFSAVENVKGIGEAFRESAEIGLRELTERKLVLTGETIRSDWCHPDYQDRLVCQHLDKAQTLHTMGARVLVIEPGTRETFRGIRQDFEEWAHRLNELGKTLQEMDLLLCVQTRHDQRVATMDEIDRLMNLLDLEVVSLCPDTGELSLAGVDPIEVLKIYAEGIRHVYWSDRVHPDNDEDPREFCEPGQGRLDFARLARTHEDRQISGWIVVEWDESTGHPQDSAFEVMEHMQAACAAAGEVHNEPDPNHGLALW